jgi:hypothetical protein
MVYAYRIPDAPVPRGDRNRVGEAGLSVSAGEWGDVVGWGCKVSCGRVGRRWSG